MEQFRNYTYTEQQRISFHSGPLRTEWASHYTELFDSDDLRLASTQSGIRAHFFEWLVAVRLYEDDHLLSLIEKYHDPSHSRKHPIFLSLAPPSVLRLFEKPRPFGMRQPPDLLVFNHDASDWFFCEVKGNRDRLRPAQVEFFHALEDASGKAVRLIRVSLR